MLERTRGGVSGIGEKRELLKRGFPPGICGLLIGLVVLYAFLIHPGKIRAGDINLSADFYRGRPGIPRQVRRHRGDGGDIGCDIFTGNAIPARSTHCQGPIPIGQRHRQAIHFYLGAEAEFRPVQPARDTFEPRVNFLIGKYVVDGLHGDFVAIGRESRGGCGGRGCRLLLFRVEVRVEVRYCGVVLWRCPADCLGRGTGVNQLWKAGL